MTVKGKAKVVNSVKDVQSAQDVIAELLVKFSLPAASVRMKNRAKESHQSVDEIARRTATNLLTSFSTKKPNYS